MPLSSRDPLHRWVPILSYASAACVGRQPVTAVRTNIDEGGAHRRRGQFGVAARGESAQLLRIGRQAEALRGLQGTVVEVRPNPRPGVLHLTKEDVGARRADALEALEQRGRHGSVPVGGLGQLAQIAVVLIPGGGDGKRRYLAGRLEA